MKPCSVPGGVLSAMDTQAKKDETLALRESIFKWNQTTNL